jgi:protoporphyrinogen IX oxidase
MSYESLKTIHIISMVAWFAGLFYIFRLFVYHSKHQKSPDLIAVFPVMERKLLHIIMGPAAILTIASGLSIILLHFPEYWSQPWLHAKLTAVLLLLGYHGLAEVTAKRFGRGDFFLSEKQCRMLNEIPTLILIAVVILVVYRPWTSA